MADVDSDVATVRLGLSEDEFGGDEEDDGEQARSH